MAEQESSHYLAGLKYSPKLDNSWVAKYLGNFRLPLLLIIATILYGIFGYVSLPRRINPEVQIPIVFISTILPGGSPNDLESLVTIPLENAVQGIDKVNTVSSTSQENASFISVEFSSTVEPDAALDEVQTKINSVQLPEDADTPTVVALDFEDVPVWSFAVASSVDEASLMRYAQELKEILEKVPTIQKVNITGQEVQEVQITIKPEAIQAYQINPLQLQQSIRAEVLSYPAGITLSNGYNFTVAIDPLIQSVDDVRNSVVSINNQSYRLSDIALISERSTPNQPETWYRTHETPSERAINFSVFKTASANIDKAARDAKTAADNFNAQHNNRFTYVTVLDFDKDITEQFTDLFTNFRASILLVFATLFVFLGIRQATIASLVIPVSFLFTFGFMQSAGLTLSFISLFSLLLAQGMIVDDTIVIISAMTDYYKATKFTPRQVGVLVWNDFIIPILTSNLTNVWSFLPLLLATGIIGEFIRVIPIVVIAALIGSTAIALLVTLPLMVVILNPAIPRRVKYLLYIMAGLAIVGLLIWLTTITPVAIPLVFMLGAAVVAGYLAANKRFPKAVKSADKGRQKLLTRVRPLVDRGILSLSGVFAAYQRALSRILASRSSRWKTVIAVIIFSLASYLLVPLGLVQNEFFPKTDQDTLYMSVELPVGTSLAATTTEAGIILDELMTEQDIESVIVELATQPQTGSVTTQPESNLISYSIKLKEFPERSSSSMDVAARMREMFADYTTGTLSVIELSGGPPAGADVQITLLGPDLTQLGNYADSTLAYLKTVPGVVDADKSIKPGISKLTFVPNRQALADAGLSVGQVGLWLRTYASGQPIDSVRFENEDEIGIILRTSPKLQTPEGLSTISIPTPSGNWVPLLSLGTFTIAPNPTLITHVDGERSITVTASVLPGYNIPQIGQQLEQFVDTQLGLTPGYDWQTGGINEENQRSVNSIFQAMIIAAVLIAATMVLQLGSFRKAFIVMSTIPLAVSGVFIMFGLTGTPLSFPALIGVLALFGIVVKNSIMIVDKINLNLASGIAFKDAVLDGSTSRLEPIIFSSITNFIGLIPITLSDPLWQGLGGAIIYGLLFSGTIMLFFIPVVYYQMFQPLPNLKKR